MTPSERPSSLDSKRPWPSSLAAPAVSAAEAEQGVVIHEVRPRNGQIQMVQDTGLQPELCALVYSYLPSQEQWRLRDSKSRYGRDIEALRHFHPVPGLGGVRIQRGAHLTPASLISFAWQARQEVRGAISRGACSDTLDSRDVLLRRAQSTERWHAVAPRILQGLLGAKWTTWAADFNLSVVVCINALLTRGRSRTVLAAGVTSWVRFLGRCAYPAVEIRRLRACNPDRTGPLPKKVMLGILATNCLAAWASMALLEIARVQADPSTDMSDYTEQMGMGLAKGTAACAFAELLFGAVLWLVEARCTVAPELYRRAEDASVLGEREQEGLHALVYLDQNERIAVDVNTQPTFTAPYLSALVETKGLELEEIELLGRARAVSEAVAQGRPVEQIVRLKSDLDFRLTTDWIRPRPLPPAEASPGARTLYAALNQANEAYQAYWRYRSFPAN